MTLNEALAVAKHVRKAREIAGQYTDVPYTQIQLVDALATIINVCGEEPVSHEEHVKITRQLTAANARLAKYEKRS